MCSRPALASTAPAAPAPRRQLLLPYPEAAFARLPRLLRRPPAPRTAPNAPPVPRLLQLPLPFDGARPRPRLVVVRGPAGTGGPDPTRPCEGCPKRARCAAPCAALAQFLPDEDTTAWNEVSSPALMAGRGVDEAFMTMPAALAGEEPAEVWPEVVARYGGERLRAALSDLTPQQRDVLELYLGGFSRAEIGTSRETSRQATHKVFWAAIGRLQRALGPLPPRAALALAASRRPGTRA